MTYATPLQGIAPRRAAPPRLRPLRFGLHAVGGTGRAEAEAFVRTRFADRHDARIDHFLPELLSLRALRDLCGVVGLCPARDHRLFVETYLDAPVEQAVSAHIGQRVTRDEVIEIGNLASSWPGASALLFVFLGEVLIEVGPRFAVFTATRHVEQLLRRRGYVATALTAADPARLPDGGALWGRYYASAPRVLCGEIAPAVRQARRSRSYRAAAAALATQVERVCGDYRARHPAAQHGVTA